MPPEKQHRTFLSYSRINKDFALQLAKELKSEGFSIWIDQLDIPAGMRWDVELEKALEECDIFMVIMTPASIESENVRDEIGYAIDNNKRILPILLKDAKVPLRLRRFQWVDFTNKSYEEGVKSAKELLRNLIAQATVPREKFPAETQDQIAQVKVDRKAKEDAQRIAKRRVDEELAAKSKEEAERKTQNEADRLAAQKAEEERLAQAKAEAERKAKEEAERLAAQKTEEERLAQAKAETERKAKEEAERLAAQKTEEERLAQAKAEAERKAKEARPELDTRKVEQKPFPTPTVIEKTAAVILSNKYLFGVAAILVVSIIAIVVLLTGKKTSATTSVGMVFVPAGNYSVGTDTSVALDEFWIDRYEITNSDYSKFIDATRNDPPEYWTNGNIPAGLRNHPVRQITWDQADEYCSWAGKRLPTETEWEIAARGPFGWTYPWGNDPDKVKQETRSTQPVDSNPANRSYFGAYFMSGNVWEWVSDPFTTTAQGEDVLRGGAYGPLDVLTYAISVTGDSPAIQNAGVRCAVSGEEVIRQFDDNLALDDDFESTTTNWPGIHEDNFLFDYHELGFYHVEAREPGKFIPAFYKHDTFTNFVLETGVFVDKANTDHEQGNFLYGLGVQITDDLFYAFVVSANDQTWQVLKGTLIEGANIGNATDLTVVASGSDSSIQGASTEMEDRLTVIANGEELIYYINGNLVYSFRIEAHQKVFVGFVVETLEDVTKVHIHYNWIQLQKIEPFENGVVKQAPTPTPTSIPATPTPTPTSPPTATPTFAPPVTPFARILDITINEQQNYVVEYETYGYTETLPGMHIHFFFDTVPQEQAGVPGSGPWILYGGPRPFTKYRVSDRPGSAKQMCALVANSNHSIQLNSGNCVDLP